MNGLCNHLALKLSVCVKERQDFKKKKKKKKRVGCGSLLLLILAVRIYTLIQLLY